jgi:hypothetical protein
MILYGPTNTRGSIKSQAQSVFYVCNEQSMSIRPEVQVPYTTNLESITVVLNKLLFDLDPDFGVYGADISRTL